MFKVEGWVRKGSTPNRDVVVSVIEQWCREENAKNKVVWWFLMTVAPAAALMSGLASGFLHTPTLGSAVALLLSLFALYSVVCWNVRRAHFPSPYTSRMRDDWRSVPDSLIAKLADSADISHRFKQELANVQEQKSYLCISDVASCLHILDRPNPPEKTGAQKLLAYRTSK